MMRTAKPNKRKAPWEFAAPWGLFHWGETNGVFTFLSLLYAIPRKSQAVRRKFIKSSQFFSDCIGAGSLPPRLMKTEGSRWLTGMMGP